MIKEKSFWEVSDKLIYYVLFPSLLVLKLGNTNFSEFVFSFGIISVVLSTLTLSAIMLIAKFIIKIPDKLFTSFFQGGIRYNSYVLLAVSLSVYGDKGLVIASIFIAYMIIFTNILSIFVMTVYGQSNKTIKDIVLSIIKNPLIVSAIVGVFIGYNQVTIPYIAKEFLQYMGQVALPMSLMSIGAGLIMISSFKKIIIIGLSIVIKLILLPLTTIYFLNMFEVNGLVFMIAVLYASVPSAGNAYILARQMGGDTESIATIITLTTILSIISIPLIIELSKY